MTYRSVLSNDFAIAVIRPPIPVTSGDGQRYNVEYECCGVPEVFLFTKPPGGRRRTVVIYGVRCDVI